MKKLQLSVSLVCILCLAAYALGGETDAPLTAAQIVEKTVAARGGLEAWQKIETMAWVGHVESASSPARKLPFLLELKRPNKTRFEISAMNQKSVRIYDGKDGWKVKPSANGRLTVENYSADDLKYAREAQIIDGPIMDYANKGIALTLEGEDEVEGRKTYRLMVKHAAGMNLRVWVDKESFLELKFDRANRNAAGVPGVVPVTLRNYQNFEGLQMPTTIETGPAVARAQAVATDKMVIEKIALNPPLEDDLFAKPRLPGQRNKIVVDTRTPPPAPRKLPTAPAGQQ
jgi:outer membrane lipoprotein-sorting protein